LVTTLVLGLSLGAIYALLAAGVTVVYQAARVPNVAIVAIGTVAAVLHGDLMAPSNDVGSGLGWWPALGVAALVAAALGLVCDAITRGLREQVVPALVALLGCSALLLAGINVVWGSEAKLLPPPWAGEFGDSGLPRSAVGTVLAAAAVGALLVVYLRRTRLGIALRAAGQDSEAIRWSGIDPATLSRAAWVISSVLGAVAMTLAIHPVLSNPFEYTTYVAFPFAAAALAGFRSLPRAAIAGLVLGVVPALIEAEQAGNASVGGAGNLIAFLVVAGVILRRPGLIGRPALDETVTSASADSSRAAARRTALRLARPRPLPSWAGRVGLAGLALVLAVGVPALSGDVALAAWSRGISVFLICASIVVVSGWTGDVPLGQVAFAGVGAYVVGALTVRAGVPHFAAVPLAALAAVPFAVFVGVPAFRSRGRLAFAALSLLSMVVAASLLWGPEASWFTGGLESMQRPNWMEGLISDRPEASFYIVALAAAAAVVWFASNLRRSRVGRALASGRDSDAAARSLGIDPAHYRLVALSFSAVVAALGGILAAYGEQPPDATRFAIFLSVQYFLYAVVGGVRSLAGTAVVVIAFEVIPALSTGTPSTGTGRVVVLGALAVVVMAVAPGGLAGLVQQLAARLAPAPVEPALASVGSGFTGVRGDAGPEAFDPYAVDDPFADDPLGPGAFPDDFFGDGHGNGHGEGDGRA
jgi:ABC-type branched-subunit amino acid transport system permease subunit